MKIFVSKINFHSQVDDLKALFEQYGTVESAKIIKDRESGKSKGYGFIEMPDDQEAKAAIAALNHIKLDGRELLVQESNKP